MGCYCQCFSQETWNSWSWRGKRKKRKRKKNDAVRGWERGNWCEGKRGEEGRRKRAERTPYEPQSQYHNPEMTYSCSLNIPVSFPIAKSTEVKGHWVEWDQAYIWMGRPIYPALAESTSSIPLLRSLIPWGNTPSVSISIVWWPFCHGNFSVMLGVAPKDCSEKGGRKKPFKVSRSSKMTLHDIKARRQRGKTKHRSRVDRAWGFSPCVWGSGGPLQEWLVARSLLCSCPSVRLSSPRDLRSNQGTLQYEYMFKIFLLWKKLGRNT